MKDELLDTQKKIWKLEKCKKIETIELKLT